MRRSWLRVVLAGCVLAGAVAIALRSTYVRLGLDHRVWGGIRATEVLVDLTATPPLEAPAATAVDGLQPGSYRGYRRAVVAPVPSAIRHRTAIPDGAVLRFGVAVDGGEGAPPTAGDVRWSVTVDATEVASGILNPARDATQRRWFDHEVRLDAAADGATLAFQASSVGPNPPTGRIGWSRIQLVRETTAERQRPGPGRPNVLVLLVDTLRADALGCYGASPSPSPTLDALAARALVFEQSVAQAPWTLPSVASIFTGLHPRSHGVVGRSAGFGTPAGVAADADWAFLSDRLPTIAAVATRAGISTFGVSSNPLVSLENNLASGFERWVNLRADWPETQWAPAHEVNRSLFRWLRGNRDRRFFAYAHYMEPHAPYTPPPDLRPPDDPSLDRDVRAGVIRRLAEAIRTGAPELPEKDVRFLRALYDAEIRAWDRALADVTDELAALGLQDDTIIVMTADHGEEFQEHGQLDHRKQLFEESIRVPLIVYVPGGPPARLAAQAQGIDLFPTLAALLGVPAPAGLPGRNLFDPASGVHPGAISETNYGLGPGGSTIELLALRRPDAKLIWAPELVRSERYDLATDPGEHRPVAVADAGDDEMCRRLETYRRTAPAPPAGNGVDPELAEKLRALGYVP